MTSQWSSASAFLLYLFCFFPSFLSLSRCRRRNTPVPTRWAPSLAPSLHRPCKCVLQVVAVTRARARGMRCDWRARRCGLREFSRLLHVGVGHGLNLMQESCAPQSSPPFADENQNVRFARERRCIPGSLSFGRWPVLVGQSPVPCIRLTCASLMMRRLGRCVTKGGLTYRCCVLCLVCIPSVIPP